MKTVKNNCGYEIEIKNSKFITVLVKVYSEDDVLKALDEVKKTYPKATHYCYAYILANSKKSSDDGEPGGTAGMPILNVLEKEEFINTLAVTVRYFGGIKLGAGGLVRAYSKSVKEAINHSIIVDVKYGYFVNININYNEQKDLDYLLRDYQIVDKKYDIDVSYSVLLDDKGLNIISNYSYQIISNQYIENVIN